MRWRWLFVLVVLYGAWHHYNTRPVVHDAGVLVADEPLEDNVNHAAVLSRPGYRIQILQSFSLRARVLSAEHYRWDREADLAPVDLALGWGPMSDESVLQHMSISQGRRFYHWRVTELPIPRRDIETHSANMHMIPATPQIEQKLRAAKSGEVVQLKGYLVEVRGDDGWRWRSSLTRDDTGAGACELVWVTDFEPI